MTNSSRIAVLDTGQNAHDLARQLRLDLVSGNEPQAEFLLHYETEGLCLSFNNGGETLRLQADWVGGKAAHRQGQPEMLSRALGISKLEKPHIIDATAGLGRDSVVIANLGADVSAIERSPVVFSLFEDAHQRAMNDVSTESWAQRVTAYQGESAETMHRIAQQRGIDEVFLDPMYPEKRKNAKAKKDMAIFQALLGKDPLQEDQLLTAALDVATYRVVVKRPIKGTFLAERPASFSIKGRSTRFDVYTKKKIS